MDWKTRMVDLFLWIEDTEASTTIRDRRFICTLRNRSSRVGYSPTRREVARLRRIYRKVFG